MNIKTARWKVKVSITRFTPGRSAKKKLEEVWSLT